MQAQFSAALFSTATRRVRSILNTLRNGEPVPCWFDYLQETKEDRQ